MEIEDIFPGGYPGLSFLMPRVRLVYWDPRLDRTIGILVRTFRLAHGSQENLEIELAKVMRSFPLMLPQKRSEVFTNL